MSHVFI